MKIKSDLQLKAEAMANGIQDFVTAVLNTAVVRKTMNVLFISFLSIGALGLLWLFLAFCCIPFGPDGASRWLRDFIVLYPKLAIVWFIISALTCTFIVWTLNVSSPAKPSPKGK
jgi:hypothetical protein